MSRVAAADRQRIREENAETELAPRLEAARDELLAARRALGVATIDCGDAKAAGRRVDQARALVEGLEAAGAELADREREADELHFNREDALRRWRVACWWRAYVARAPAVIKARAMLAAAEASMIDLGSLARAHQLGHGNAFEWLSGESTAGRLDVEALNVIPDVAVMPQSHQTAMSDDPARAFLGTLTLEQVDALKPRVDALVERLAAAVPGDDLPADPWTDGAP
jgi:hypothetical protein